MSFLPARGKAETATRRLVPTLAVVAVAGLLTAAAIAPQRLPTAAAQPAEQRHGALGALDGQELELVQAAIAGAPVERDGFAAEAPPPPVWASAPEVPIPDEGTIKAIGYQMAMAVGWDENEWRCLAALWQRESNWNPLSGNAVSGAYGIPQALPGEKMASAGADWQTNPATQIAWGIGYIQSRYGTPCGAWAHSEESGWY
ncbi:MAG: transglycosylase SLT domain-containing protein [Microbacteriaceae bacterium]|nr:transglycosylase SLT domain-containing protein [Microbacteriaceae bacterium]